MFGYVSSPKEMMPAEVTALREQEREGEQAPPPPFRRAWILPCQCPLFPSQMFSYIPVRLVTPSSGMDSLTWKTCSWISTWQHLTRVCS